MRRGGAQAALAVLWCALLLGTHPSSAAAAGCAALDYEASLTAASTALRSAPPDPAAAQRDVSSLLAVDPGRGLALGRIVSDLSGQPPDIADAEHRLTAMSAALAYPSGSTCNDDGAAARGTLHDVYASPPFRHLDDAAQTNPLSAVLHAIASAISGAAGALGQAGWLVVILAIAAILAVLAARRWRAASRTLAVVRPESPPLGDDPGEEWAVAERAAAAGDFREAVRRAFRSALLDVAARGRVHVDAAWTTRELLERCNADGDVLAALAGAAALFDHAWYAGVNVTRADWEVAAARCQALRGMARARRTSIS